jgi:hypothetical protein
VAFSAIDSTIAGFETFVIMNATKPVDLPGSIESTFKAFNKHKINRINV